jgi:hypothetical protein
MAKKSRSRKNRTKRRGGDNGVSPDTTTTGEQKPGLFSRIGSTLSNLNPFKSGEPEPVNTETEQGDNVKSQYQQPGGKRKRRRNRRRTQRKH